ncbi:cytochrome C assembly protein, partial [Oligoflexia bacterium]|nr:cytochrome C assembly protein [Oligoflexia bacterium]
MTSSLRFFVEKILPPIVFVLICYANYLVFLWVPNEQIMGPVQRIFYYHVGSAIACYFSFGIVFVASLAYLANRSAKADMMSEAAGEVGFILCT